MTRPLLAQHRRGLLGVVVPAVLAGLLISLGASPAVADRPLGPPIVSEPPRGGLPARAGESTVTLVLRDAESATARSAAGRLRAEASTLLRSDAAAAGRRELLARTRLPAPARAAAGTLVGGFATRHGLRIVDQGAGYLTVAGAVGRLARAFSTTLRSVATEDAGELAIAATALAVPPELAGVVGSAHGLDDRPAVRPRAVPMGYEGRHLRAAYRVPSDTRGGAGTTVATVQFSGWDRSDLDTYAATAGIELAPSQVTEISVNGANPAQHDGFGGAFEVALDTQAVLAVAPSARQRIYFTTNNFAGAVAVYTRLAQDAEAGLITTASSSWGSCEQFSSLGAAADIATQIRRIVAAGATFAAASGDAGGYDCSTASSPHPALAVDFPASLPETLAVGGTTLPPLASGNDVVADTARERAWGVNAGSYPAYQGDGSGGGASVRYARPAYQASIPIPGTTRLVPDLAALADAETGLGVYVASAGGWFTGGGTSLAAPLVAGMLADAASVVGRTSGPGDIHGAIYVNQQAFRDITVGASNAFAATPGYDRVTGLGAPIIELLAPAIGLTPAPSPSVEPSPTSTGTPGPSPSASTDPTATPTPSAAPTPPTLVAPSTATAGVLITVSGTADPGAEVELWGVTAPNATITRVNTPTALADANGNWAKTIRPLRNVNLQARVGDARSATRFIAVSTAVTQSVAPLAGCVVQVAGRVFEPKPGATVFMRAVDSAGRTVSLGSGFVEGDGRFLLRRPYACGQRLSVYTVISGDSVNRPGATPTQAITTRR